jgi:hypothetical protein
MRRFGISLALSAVLLMPLSARTDETPAIEQQTTVHGTPPALAGHWLALGHIELPGGKLRSVPALWEVIQHDGQPEIRQRFVGLPPEQQRALEQATSKEQKWQPTPADLGAIQAAWDSLPPRGGERVKQLNHELFSADALDETMQSAPETKGSLWILREVESFLPGQGAAMTQISVYAAHEARDGGYSGKFVLVNMVAAPFPIPISFQGTFEMLPVAEGAAPTLFQRVRAYVYSWLGW